MCRRFSFFCWWWICSFNRPNLNSRSRSLSLTFFIFTFNPLNSSRFLLDAATFLCFASFSISYFASLILAFACLTILSEKEMDVYFFIALNWVQILTCFKFSENLWEYVEDNTFFTSFTYESFFWHISHFLCASFFKKNLLLILFLFDLKWESFKNAWILTKNREQFKTLAFLWCTCCSDSVMHYRVTAWI